MTVRKLRNSWWVDFRVAGQRYRKRSPQNSAASAKAYEQLLRRRIALGEPLEPLPTPRVPTLAEFAPEWLARYAKPNNKASEQRSKESALRLHLLPWFGKTPLDAFSVASIEEYKAARLEAGLTAKTVNNHLTILRKCLDTAVDWERIDRIPRIKWLPTEPVEQDFLTVAESYALIEATDEPMWRAMLLLALRTGMRLGELCGLLWSDVDFERRIITVRRSIVRGIVGSPKNHKMRRIAFPESAVAALRQMTRGDDLVFTRPEGGPLSQRIAENAIHRFCRRAGLRAVGWHTLRHTCASQLADLRGNLLEAQRILGHSSLATTEIYTHVVPTALHEAVATLDAAHAAFSVGNRWATQPGFPPLHTCTLPVAASNLPSTKQKHTADGVLGLGCGGGI